MHNQLKLLSNQAKEYGMDKTSTYGGYEPIGFMDYYTEKLAELIIKECLNQCYDRGMNDELYEGQLRAASYIEQHFGIEG